MVRDSIEIGQKVTLDTLECSTCGTPFAMSSSLRMQRRRDHNNFYCPNGHSCHYPGESREERAERLLAEERERSSRLRVSNDEILLQMAGMKREANLRDRRTSNGVCAHCHRSFKHVRRHMQNMHPEQVMGLSWRLYHRTGGKP